MPSRKYARQRLLDIQLDDYLHIISHDATHLGSTSSRRSPPEGQQSWRRKWPEVTILYIPFAPEVTLRS